MKQFQNSSVINLESLIDLSARLIEIAEPQKILRSAALSLIGKLKFTRFGLFFPQEDSLIESGTGVKIKKKRIESFMKIKGTDESLCRLLDLGYEYCLPVFNKEELYSVICFGRRFIKAELTEEEHKYARLVSSIAANSIENALNVFDLKEQQTTLKKRNQLLRTLFEISNDFNKMMSHKQILKLLSFHLMGQLAVTKFAVIMAQEDGSFKVLVNRFGKDFSGDYIKRSLAADEVLFPSLLNDECFKKNPEVSIAVPMKLQSKTKGVLLVGGKYSGAKFGRSDVSFLESLANVAVSSLENERLFREEIEKRQLESELEFARDIQQNLLPKKVPKTEKFDIAGLSLPSRDVGGDYYDVFEKDGSIYICIADVSGKGMPASLIMANFQAALRIISGFESDLTKIVLELNKIVFNNTSPDKFITMFIGILDQKTGKFEYINAGHNAPLLLKDGETLMLEKGGMLLGILEEGDDYETGQVLIGKNDILYLFTDGVNEAEDDRKVDFGDERIVSAIRENSRMSSKQLLDEMLRQIADFTGGAAQYDDITMIAVKGK